MCTLVLRAPVHSLHSFIIRSTVTSERVLFVPLHTDMQDDSETVAHPDAATIEAYCLGQVTEAAINFIEAHITNCPECGRKIAECVRQQMGVKRP